MSTQVAVQLKKPTPTIKDRLQGPEFRAAVAAVLPKHLTPDRFLRVAILATTRTPKLAQCDQASFFNALLTLSQLGLEPDGRRAHLIPFENRKRGVTECQLIVDWKGLAELAMRSGIVANLHADVVSAGDEFVYNAGKIRSHVPWFLRRDPAKPTEPGEMFAAYAIAEFKDGSSKAEVLSISEVESIRARSKAADSGPWVTDYAEMAKKTAFRRLSKWLPLSPEFRDAVEADDEIKQPAPIDVPTVTMAPAQFDLAQAHDDDQIHGAEVQPPPVSTATPETPKADNGGLGVIRRRLEMDGINEGDAMGTVYRMFPNTQGCNTLDEVEHQFPNVVNAIARSLKTFVPTVKEDIAKGGSK